MNKNSKTGKNAIFVGLPGSGKSSFIAALWHVVESNELAESLRIIADPDDTTYLNQIRSQWYSCQPLDRTKTSPGQRITLEVAKSNSQEVYEFVFPDVAGEIYVHQFQYRRIAKEDLNLLDNVQGVLLFLDPIIPQEHQMIHDFDVPGNTDSPSSNEVEDRNLSLGSESMGPSPKTNDRGVGWTPQACPTQVVIVDNLQILFEIILQPIRVSIIVSKWDVVKADPDPASHALTPRKWVESKMPLLSQFLTSNFNPKDVKFFGISAQGGSYDESAEHLGALVKPTDRIIVITEDIECKDITLPIQWILNDD